MKTTEESFGVLVNRRMVSFALSILYEIIALRMSIIPIHSGSNFPNSACRILKFYLGLMHRAEPNLKRLNQIRAIISEPSLVSERQRVPL